MALGVLLGVGLRISLVFMVRFMVLVIYLGLVLPTVGCTSSFQVSYSIGSLQDWFSVFRILWDFEFSVLTSWVLGFWGLVSGFGFDGLVALVNFRFPVCCGVGVIQKFSVFG